LLWGVHEQKAPQVLIVGCVVAAATTGALIAMGRRLGSVAFPFASISAIVFRSSGFTIDSRSFVGGLLLHVVFIFLWSMLAVQLARGLGATLSALLTTTTQFVVSWLIAWWSGSGLASALVLGDRLAYAVVLASALVVGMRFAFSHARNDSSHVGAM
jgi:tryptophan-rich sensory protein